ncbi:MAG TPA: insulinase family protein [Bacteroidetes bacterium]|nr:insulinase family protein [Bacteroidota bacterium]
MTRIATTGLALALLAGGCSSSAPATPADAEVPVIRVPEAPGVSSDRPATDPETSLDTPLSLDLAVRTGVLDNGLTYYVRENTEPEARAELRLVVNAGSLLEEDDQQGLAHMLEHMAFNGTERFPEQALVQYLERIGMQFGPDVNAYTSFDETVYMLQVPTDSMETFTTGLDVLREWAGAVTISEEEVEKERGVVLEEWRLRQGAQGRIQREQLPVLLAGSRYAERLPIGDTDVLETAPAQRLRDFYRDWYRPDLMAIVVVGDVDGAEVEAMIRERFADLANPADAPERVSFDVPPHEDTRYVVSTDPELPQSRISVDLKSAPSSRQSVGDFRSEIVRQVFTGMLNERLAERARGADAPFAIAFASLGGGLRAVNVASLAALIPETGAAPALEALVTEAERARRFGFTQGEFERRKAEIRRGYERALAEKENTESRRLAGLYVNQFLKGDIEPGIDQAAAYVFEFLPTITLEEVNAMAEALLQTENRVVSVSLPEKDGLVPPTESELAAVLDGVSAAEIEPYEDAVTDGPLIAELPPAGEVVQETVWNEDADVTEMVLSNGARLLVKPTDFKEEEVLMTAFSPGGTSLLDLETYRQSQFATAVVSEGGVGAFDAVALGKALAGKVVSVRPFLSEREEGFSGSASPADLETLFQLVHLYATAPREDATALATLQTRLGAFLANMGASPEVAFRDTVAATLANYHPRRETLTLEAVQQQDLATSLAVYRERFADADDFTFVIVGNVELGTVRQLAAQYLATLPTLDREDAPRDVDVQPPPGVVQKTVRRGVEPKAQVQITFHGELEGYSFETESALQVLGDVLQTRLREELREERGGVYFVRVEPMSWREPRPEYRFTVGFGTDPERVDELIGAVMDAIAEIKTEGPEARYVENVRESARRAEETNRRENGYWLRALSESARYGTALADVIADAERRQSATPESVQATAQRYLDPEQYVQVVLLPEADAASEE